MIPRLLALALAPVRAANRWLETYCAAMIHEALTDPAIKAEAEAILAAAQCPEFVEPPDDADPEPIYQELVTEVVRDAAATRLWEDWDADTEAWEDERIDAYRRGEGA